MFFKIAINGLVGGAVIYCQGCFGVLPGGPRNARAATATGAVLGTPRQNIVDPDARESSADRPNNREALFRNIWSPQKFTDTGEYWEECGSLYTDENINLSFLVMAEKKFESKIVIKLIRNDLTARIQHVEIYKNPNDAFKNRSVMEFLHHFSPLLALKSVDVAQTLLEYPKDCWNGVVGYDLEGDFLVDLFDQKFSTLEKKGLLVAALEAMKELHSLGIVHGSISPHSILVQRNSVDNRTQFSVKFVGYERAAPLPGNTVAVKRNRENEKFLSLHELEGKQGSYMRDDLFRLIESFTRKLYRNAFHGKLGKPSLGNLKSFQHLNPEQDALVRFKQSLIDHPYKEQRSTDSVLRSLLTLLSEAHIMDSYATPDYNRMIEALTNLN